MLCLTIKLKDMNIEAHTIVHIKAKTITVKQSRKSRLPEKLKKRKAVLLLQEAIQQMDT